MNKTEILFFILVGTAYKIKTFTGEWRYNISRQDSGVLKSSEQTIISDTSIPSKTFTFNGDSPRE